MPQLNGRTKAIAGVIAVAALVFGAGAIHYRVTSHVDNVEKHETADTKNRRIDERVQLHLKPLEVKLDQMDKKIDRLLDDKGRQ